MNNNKQPQLSYYMAYNSGKFDGIENESIMDKELTSTEKIEIMKTLIYNFFDDNTLIFGYYLLSNVIPPNDHLKAQFGFMNCITQTERYNLLHLYKTAIYKCYNDMFVFTPMRILYQYFIEDNIAEFILTSYGRIKYTDTYFMWFIQNQYIVKHNVNYNNLMERKRNLFVKNAKI